MADGLRHPIRYRVEAIALRFVLGVLGSLPLGTASAMMAALFRSIGPRLRVSGRAVRNLQRAFPDKSATEINTIVRGMWDHLGRLVAEYVHLEDLHCFLPGSQVEVINPEIFAKATEAGRGAIVITGHIGNWEAQGFAATDQGIRASVVYRAANNPLVDRVIHDLRTPIVEEQFAKGAGGVRGILKFLKSGGLVAMLVDQKMNDGVPVPFFGADVMTPPAAAEIAYKYDYPLIPLRSERLEGSRYRVTVYPPLEKRDTGDRSADVGATMVEINEMLEGWIRERPEQWLWLHNRWPAKEPRALDPASAEDQDAPQTN
jgi:Kdo2-lipid IVA lauroyltransferase/acyltransferase